MQTRQFYTSITATGQLYFDMPNNSRIRGVVFAATTTSATAGADNLTMEIALQSSTQVAVNDAQNVIAVCNFTAGDGVGGYNFYSPADMAVKSGERVYFNYTEAGTATWVTRVIVWFD